MIKYHPTNEMLKAFTAGELPLSLSIAMSAHIELCDCCAKKIEEIEASLSEEIWKEEQVEVSDFGDMLQEIMSNEVIESKSVTISTPIVTKVSGKEYLLPTAFRSFVDLNWSGFSAVNRARVITDEKNVRASLLHISKGGRIPEHQHKGYELTLLLEGSFSDENGTYQKGDFIWLDGSQSHSPYTEEGCLCYAVQDAPLHFMRGMSKALNPLGNLIY